MLKLPYGISNFHTVRNEGYYYIDRTACLPVLESSGKQLVFLRPRRFGKSLFLSMLAYYYDIHQAEQFKGLFGNLAIGSQPSAEHNQYLILRWDFSKVSGQGTITEIKHSLFSHLNISIEGFAAKYQAELKKPIVINSEDAIASFQSLCSALSFGERKLYLLIDEYDNFANEVLIHQNDGQQRYKDLLAGEGIVKTLFKVIKASAAEGAIARVFITGVSPVVLADMTSGYNVATSIYLNEEFNQLCGITEVELSQLVQQVAQESCTEQTDYQALLTTMREYYNGYRFCYDLNYPTIYNPTLCFYFLQYYQRRCQAPFEMLDGNLAMDAGRIRYMAKLPAGAQVIEQILDDENPVTVKHLATQFGVEQLNELRTNPDYIASLMYFFGVLTIVDIQGLNKLVLKAPNLVTKALYVEEFKRHLFPESRERQRLQSLVEDFYQSGELEPLADYLEQTTLSTLSNRDYQWSNELTIKMAFLTPLFDDSYYIIDSEATVRRRYSDLVMIIRPSLRETLPTLRDLVLEFKYLKLSEVGMSGTQVRESSREALLQLPAVQTQLQAALEQLEDYQTTLVQRYQQPERLVCLAVVAVGFERVVWQRL
ncbi:MAG: AAA family ATPase [Thiofilum sp.]|uniref:AAA family ATPase n=1 Tax=Thiofilum sp. TaxID=2212733 RepID=UPI0025FDFBA5|nr:AAA family ATPase [Thiofilum sp.]MBK8454842.1 AAA family ATPase [Thiofilum sp.]